MTTRDPDPFVMYIVVRRSLKLSPGKIGSQCGHAVHYMMQDDAVPGEDRHPPKEEIELRLKTMHPETMTDQDKERLRQIDEERAHRFERGKHFQQWADGDHAKIVLGASDDDFMKVQLENDPIFMVTDLGYTQVEPNTQTALGLWPMRKSWASPTVKNLRPL